MNQRTPKILVMDDEPTIREVATVILKSAGNRVETANDGQDALNRYSIAGVSDDPFDVVVLDLTVPGGMGGQAALLELRKLDPFVKAIASSGYRDDPPMADPESHGFAGVAAKPYTRAELAGEVERLLKAK